MSHCKLFTHLPSTKPPLNKFFLIGTAPPEGEVAVNGQVIRRSSAGHFAPSLPLKVGLNTFTLRYQGQVVTVQVTRTPTTLLPRPGWLLLKSL